MKRKNEGIAADYTYYVRSRNSCRSVQCVDTIKQRRMKNQFLSYALVLVLFCKYGRSCERRDGNQLYKRLNSSTLAVSLKNDRVTLNLQKTGSKQPGDLKLVLMTKSSLESSDFVGKPEVSNDCDINTVCIKIGNTIHTRIQTSPTSDVVKITRLVNDVKGSLTDCVRLADGVQWIGGPQWRYQRWPVQHMYFEEEPYVPTHQNQAAVIERYWLSSTGFYLYVDERAPLFLDQNNLYSDHLCLVAKNKAPYRNRTRGVTLEYEIGSFDDSRAAHEFVATRHLGWPTDVPDTRMVAHPIWSTWARYKVYVNDSVVREFADEIEGKGFDNSQLEIDDNWETCYGSAKFDPVKFPDVAGLMDDLHGRGFRVTLWIHPFINENCNDGEAYDYAVRHDYVVKNTDGDYKSTWWQGDNAVAIDFTNAEAVQWWVDRLRKLQNLGIDSFKFDAGEITFTATPVPVLHTGDEDLQPGIYTKDYVTALADNFNSMIEVRSAWLTQRLPIFYRMIDKDSRWTYDNGLPTLITTLLQMNMQGYPFVLPDMIGGNGYVPGDIKLTSLPSKEIFIRWLQANTFMPSVQYSFVPWDYDSETVELAKKFTKMHADVSPTIIDLMRKTVLTGAPVNPPIWWIDPTDQQAHKINDEFLLGEDILVAPVIHEGFVARDIYLPKGRWRDGNDGKQYQGPTWLNDYSAPLELLPHFYRL